MAFLPSILQWLQDHQYLPNSSFPLLFLSLCFLFFLLRQKSTSKSNLLPPSPPKLPIIGNLHQLGKHPHRSLDAFSKKYGPLMLLHIGRIPTLVVSSSEMAKEIMKTHDVVFSDKSITTALRAFVLDGRDIVFAPYGDYWRQVRKICIVDLLSVKRVESYKLVREEETANMTRKLTEACKMRKTVNISKMINAVTNNIICKIVMGRKLEGEVGSKSELGRLTQEVKDLVGNLCVGDMFPSLGWVDVLTGLDRRIKRISKRFHEFLDEVIEEHMCRKREEEDGDGKDFVDILLVCQKDVSLGISMSNSDLKAIIMDMFVVGTDAIYTTLEWAMGELMKNPIIMKKVQEEVRLVVGKKPKLDENDINQMNYLNCVIKETLRLHPGFPLPRVSTAPINIGAYSIPPGTRVIINAWAIGRDPKCWDRAEEFIPDRFINNPIDFKGSCFEFIPFGGGRRSCPGIAFGIAVVESILANLLCWFDWELSDDVNKLDLNDNAFGLGIHLKHSIFLNPVSEFP